MTKIMIFKAYNISEENAQKAAHELGFELYYIDYDYKRDLDNQIYQLYYSKIRWAEQNNIDCIICSYYDYPVISTISTEIPLIPSGFSSWETLNIIFSLNQEVLSKRTPRPHKIGLLTHRPILINLETINAIFDLDTHNIIYRNDISVPEKFFSQLKTEGFEVIVCAERYFEHVISAGMIPFYNENAHSYIGLLDDLKRILEIITISLRYNQRRHELRQMIDYSFEAVWMTNYKGIITVHNTKAAEIFSKYISQPAISAINGYVGKSVFDVLPETMNEIIEDALLNGTNYYSHVLLHSPTDGVFNINPIFKENFVDSVIFHFVSMPHFETMEEQIKNVAYVKGHVAKYTFKDIIGRSDTILETINLAERFAKYESNVLLIGESGTGKELFAQSIHNASKRYNQPFVALNCGALTPSLLESELFGYVDGSFTGASKKGKKGLFEIADQGTIFLDEISEMSAQGQIRLLRVLEEHVVMRIGSDKVIPVDVRIIAACNKNLLKQVENGNFRQDLFFRLNVLSLEIPPLRERSKDITLISDYYLEHYSQKYQKSVHFNLDAHDVLLKYNWPGNIRQLRNFCERLVIIANTFELSSPFVKEQLAKTTLFSITPVNVEDSQPVHTTAVPKAEAPSSNHPVYEDQNSERNDIIKALNETNGNRQQTAQLLNMSTTTLWRKIKKYNIDQHY